MNNSFSHWDPSFSHLDQSCSNQDQSFSQWDQNLNDSAQLQYFHYINVWFWASSKSSIVNRPPTGPQQKSSRLELTMLQM